MIPYIELHTFDIGPLTIQVWGTLVALGFVLGTLASGWYAKTRQLEVKIFWDTLAWVIIGALVLSRFFHVLFYDFQFFVENPMKIFAVWEGGFSVIGGFIGAVIIGAWYLSYRKVKFWPYFDAGIFGLPLGLFIGRMGCALIHDHPGKETNFFLGVEYPDGIIRHDHGLYLSINGLILFLVFLLLKKFKVREGTYTAVFLLWYGAVRFILDFYRATEGTITDARYLGLTPAQYAGIVMFGLGLFVFFKPTKTRQSDLAD